MTFLFQSRVKMVFFCAYSLWDISILLSIILLYLKNLCSVFTPRFWYLLSFFFQVGCVRACVLSMNFFSCSWFYNQFSGVIYEVKFCTQWPFYFLFNMKPNASLYYFHFKSIQTNNLVIEFFLCRHCLVFCGELPSCFLGAYSVYVEYVAHPFLFFPLLQLSKHTSFLKRCTYGNHSVSYS